jgi:hypothetical protein
VSTGMKPLDVKYNLDCNTAQNSVKIGNHLRTYNENEIALGCYNQPIDGGNGAIFTFGMGDATKCLNAIAISPDGEIFIKGIGGYDGGSNITSSSIKSLQDILGNM